MIRTAAASPVDTRFNRGLAFGIGLLLPLLTLQTSYIGTPQAIAERIVPVDLVCLLLLATLFFFHRLKKPPLTAFLYLAAMVASIVVVSVRFHEPDGDFWISLAAIVMAFCFYLVGLNLGSSRVLARALLGGLMISVLLEAIPVYHDFFLKGAQWFPDPMEGRARGTFRASGQLAAFGFCAAGLLITFGWFHARKFAILSTISGLVAASFVVMASRRSAILGMVLWAVLFVGVGVRFYRRGYYKLFAGSLIVGVLGFLACWGQISQSFLGQRLEEGVGGLNSADGFIRAQWTNAMGTMDEWFPWGYGAGRGRLINLQDLEAHEVHNGILAVLVELGVVGLLGFLGMILQPLINKRRFAPTGRHALLKVLIGTFIVTSLVFMFHNTLYRDRVFLVYIGLATAVALPSRIAL